MLPLQTEKSRGSKIEVLLALCFTIFVYPRTIAAAEEVIMHRKPGEMGKTLPHRLYLHINRVTITATSFGRIRLRHDIISINKIIHSLS